MRISRNRVSASRFPASSSWRPAMPFHSGFPPAPANLSGAPWSGWTAAAQNVPRWRPQGTTMRILIIEDDAAIADAIVASLTRAGHAVDRLSGGRQADAALQAHPYDLIVLDLG